MRFEDIIKKENEIHELGHCTRNNIIEYVDIDVIAHFSNCVCFEIYCKDIVPFSHYNTTNNVGYLIRAFTELLDLSKEDGVRISEFKNIPCRLVFEKDGGWGDKAIGIGHFIKNKFILFSEFVKIDEL